jgi:eukaryotic-like serine/threonine-protein kinase
MAEVRINKYIGQQFGNYRLTRLIGMGGFAEVYLGEHIYLKTQAAIKILQTRLSQEERESFYAEARTVAHLQHEHIVRVLEFGLKDDSIPYLVMEYAPRGTLCEQFTRGTPTPLARILPPFKQVSSALQYAHDEHLIHRDIKPENMLLGFHNEVLLSDFGIALMVKGSLHQDKQEVAGTVTYMAPEQLLGKATLASDQYALGVVVYEWLAGERPFQGTFTEIATQHLLTAPPSLQQRIPDIPVAVERVVARALEKEPGQRFASVQDFAHALEAAAEGREYYAEEASVSPGNEDANTPHVILPATVSAIPPLSGPRRIAAVSRTLKIALLALAVLIIVGTGLTYTLLQPKPMTIEQKMQALYESATSSKPVIEDSLSSESLLSLGKPASGCRFEGGTLHAAAAIVALCASTMVDMDDFAYQAEMTIDKGSSGGLVFRYGLLSALQSGVVTGIYYFTVTTQGQFSLESEGITFLDGKLSTTDLQPVIKQQHSTAIKAGLHQTNLLSVIARGPNIYLFINRKFVGSVKDNVSPSGTIGMFSNNGTPFDITFKNMKVWKL